MEEDGTAQSVSLPDLAERACPGGAEGDGSVVRRLKYDKLVSPENGGSANEVVDSAPLQNNQSSLCGGGGAERFEGKAQEQEEDLPVGCLFTAQTLSRGPVEQVREIHDGKGQGDQVCGSDVREGDPARANDVWSANEYEVVEFTDSTPGGHFHGQTVDSHAGCSSSSPSGLPEVHVSAQTVEARTRASRSIQVFYRGSCARKRVKLLQLLCNSLMARRKVTKGHPEESGPKSHGLGVQPNELSGSDAGLENPGRGLSAVSPDAVVGGAEEGAASPQLTASDPGGPLERGIPWRVEPLPEQVCKALDRCDRVIALLSLRSKSAGCAALEALGPAALVSCFDGVSASRIPLPVARNVIEGQTDDQTGLLDGWTIEEIMEVITSLAKVWQMLRSLLDQAKLDIQSLRRDCQISQDHAAEITRLCVGLAR